MSLAHCRFITGPCGSLIQRAPTHHHSCPLVQRGYLCINSISMQSTTPSLCGSFLSDKRSLIAFTWTLTTVLTLAAFVLAAVVAIHTHTSYKRLEHYYQEQYAYNQQYHKQQNDEGGEAAGEAGASADREYEAQMKLSQMHSSSMTFVAVYTMSMALALSLYGSTAIVGFTSLRGVYIAPCFSYPSSSKLKVGIFGGAIIFFANLLLVCAVIFGEVRVSRSRREAVWCKKSHHIRIVRWKIGTTIATKNASPTRWNE